MRFTNEYRYLPFFRERREYPILRVVAENPLTTRRNFDRNPPDLSLIWSQEGTLAERGQKNSSARDPAPVPVPVPVSRVSRLMAWLNANEGVFGALGLVGVLVAAGFFFGSWYMKSELKEELRGYVDTSLEKTLGSIREDIRKTREDVIKLQTGLANLQGKFGSVEGIVYRERATALGFADPKISLVRLVKSPDSRIEVYSPDGGRSYSFSVTVDNVEKGYIRFLVSGKIGGLSLSGNLLRIPYQVEAPINITEVIGMFAPTPGIPDIWMSILNFPSPDSAVIAIGPRKEAVS